ncbi:omptin family outer membrane protease [Treponema sp.]|uniref:omptin family outer membrane protease n=1 Tax=Treponema sp. TaxID=166 RepID=UPI00298EADD7|nr:omptin family outer membrane protease [Treponema sp.]MCQ2241769.1 omptin family outer membrane protease [Treponema sp.]
MGTVFPETSFFIEPYTGFAYGSLNKYIFSSKGEKELSCLEWETKPLFYAGAKLGFENEILEIFADCDVGLPKIVGKMYDSDFYYDSNYPDGNKCNYTIHDNEALKNINTEIGFKYKSKISEKLSIKPSIQLQYTYDSFVSKNGYGWYGRDAYSTTGQNESYASPYARKVKVLGVEYYRHTFYTWLGTELVFEPEILGQQKMDVSIGFMISPFTYTSSMDHHLSNVGNDYHQQEIEYSYLTRIKLNTMLNYRLNSKVSLNAGANLIYGTLEKGDTYSDKNNSKGMEKINQKTGADIMQLRTLLGCRFNF